MDHRIAFAWQCSLCGPREAVNSATDLFEGDDSCEFANDGVCQDGRVATPTQPSVFTFLGGGVWAHVCGYLTDSCVVTSTERVTRSPHTN